MVRGLVHSDELVHAGYNVVLTGKKISDEVISFEQRSAEVRSSLGKRGLKAPNSNNINNLDANGKKNTVLEKQVAANAALLMPDPRELLANRLQVALRLLNQSYRVLSTTEPFWDAVEGAARSSCVDRELKRPSFVPVETLIPRAAAVSKEVQLGAKPPANGK